MDNQQEKFPINALESMKREADYTTTGIDDDGVLNALRHFSLI